MLGQLFREALVFQLALVLSCTLIGAGAQQFAALREGPLSRSEGGLQFEPIEAVPARGVAGPLFESLPGSGTGIDLVHQFPTNAPFVLLQDQGAGTGVCAGDCDADGLPDLFISNYDQGNRLYRNLGHWRFEDITARAGVSGEGRWCAGATFVDIDNDDDLDLYVCVFNAPNLLYVNQGGGVFKEQAKAFGLDFTGASVMLAFADYDLDGWLDGYLITHRLTVGTGYRLPKSSKEAFDRSMIQIKGGRRVEVDPRYRELFEVIDKGSGRTELIIAGQADHLFHNNGNGTFSDVSGQAGIRGSDIGLAVSWWDYNDDGFPDIYVSNDYKGPDRLYHNHGNGTFTDVTRTALPHVPWSSMGSDAGDLNNDGWMDLMATDMAGATHFRRAMTSGDLDKDRWFFAASNPKQVQRNTVYLGTGTERAFEMARLLGLEATDWTWSPKFADLDNDGWMDLFIANGMSRDFVNADLLSRMTQRDSSGWRSTPVLREENLAFRNLGNLEFKRAGREWGLNQITASFGAAFADFDRDGDLDLVVANFGEPVSIYRNAGSENNRALFRLKGVRSNSWGIGATVRIDTSSGVQTRCLMLASGFMSANQPLVHFGLGEARKIDRLRIEWPSGHRQSFEDLEPNRIYTITEPGGAPPQRTKPARTPSLFKRGAQLEGIRHRERDYDDYQREPLLPWKLSQLGPGLAVGDVNGDGLEDLFLAGAAGQSGMLCIHEASGRFRPVPQPCLDADQASEGMGALFFDADSDGDLDLYTVSGGVECEPNDAVLLDRLYLNDGRGNFSKAPEGTLPDLRDSGSAVAAADFDRDGDLDLFVGGRCKPGEYPLAANSRLIRNDGGRFVEATDQLAPGLMQSGLVTSAVWSDANGDGWLDLLVTHEWGPVKLYVNNQGRFDDRTKEAGLADKLGWWNGIAARDLDGDLDIDYVVTNLGLNTQYRASPQKPALAFYGEFDNTGRKQLIEACYEAEKLYPRRGRIDTLSATPSLTERYRTFQSFAEATVEDVYTAERLGAAQRFEVNTLESGVLLNDGLGHFAFHPLPPMAQVSPTFGVALADIDGDGNADLYLVQNLFTSRPETGQMDGGLSLLLRGNGDGRFTPVWPHASGLIVPGDAKGLAVTDLTNDGWPDFVVALNNDEIKAFENQGSKQNRLVNIRLEGRRGNPAAIGARVTITLDDGSTQTAEVAAGGGYLSQSTSTLAFGLGEKNQIRDGRVRWPDGKVTVLGAIRHQSHLTLKQP